MEVVSPDSLARDTQTKPIVEYARAGIPHFWLVDLDPRSGLPVVRTYEREPVTHSYVPVGTFHDRLKTDVPFPVSLDLTVIDRM